MSNEVINSVTGVVFSDEDKKLIFDQLKSQIARDLTDGEFKMFLYICSSRNLNPLKREIYAINRGGKMSIQTSIDGFRVIAERTKMYAPGKDTEFLTTDKGQLMGAKVYVKKKTADGTWHEVSATAFVHEYTTNQNLWKKMPSVMIEKCFSSDTYVLTENGFEKFSEVTGRIMQVTDSGLEPVNAVPFSNKYNGDMIEVNSQRLDFCVTPNHDMVTTFGKVEAGAMYETTHNRGPWKIPMNIDFGSICEEDADTYRLIGFLLADGSRESGSLWRIEVSRKYKIDELMRFEDSYKGIRRAKGDISNGNGRVIRTNFDKCIFKFKNTDLIDSLILPDKSLNTDALSQLTQAQAKLIIDAWQFFDGHTNKKTGVRRIYTSRNDHCQAIELLSCMAGYSISTRKTRHSDISSKDGYSYTISKPLPVKVLPPISGNPGLIKTTNVTGKVWCVTVPSGKIVVRRNGFSMICGNCAEARALRRSFPEALAGLYSEDEMEQANNPKIEAEEIEQKEEKKIDRISDETWEALDTFLNGYEKLREELKKLCKVHDLRDITTQQLDAVRKYAENWVKRNKKN